MSIGLAFYQRVEAAAGAPAYGLACKEPNEAIARYATGNSVSIVRHGKIRLVMSEMGQKRTWRDQIAMSALPPKADIPRRRLDVRFVP